MADTLDGPVALIEFIDRACDEFERGWLARTPAPLEDVVRSAPESVRAGLFRELLAVERAYRERAGQPISADEAVARFGPFGPWAEDAIQELLAPTVPALPGGGTVREFSTASGPQPEPLPPTIGGYRVLRCLGGGGMGVVYLADDPLGQRQVAIKVMRAKYACDLIACGRFIREARAAMAVEHDHVVPVYQVGMDRDIPFIVMPVLKGESLEDRLGREPLPPLGLVFRVGREVALGLAGAHEKGLVHRDVKPANTWLEGDAASADPGQQVRRVKVLDFGLARSADGSDGLTATGGGGGTPAYMAPEQAAGRPVDARADLFSLGAVLYRMAAGRPAFAGPTISAILTAVATHHPPPPGSLNPAVPPALSELIMRLLEKEPGKRPATARAVADALTAIEKERAQAAPTPRPARTGWLIGVAALLALCVTAIVVRPLFRASQPGETAIGEKPGAGADPGNRGGTPQTESEKPDTGSRGETGPVTRGSTPRTDPFRVKSLNVQHFAKTAKGDEPRGALGRDSFLPRLGDKVQVAAKLSRPGYAYIIAFRPDGVADLCFPDDEDTAPPLTDTPRYPTTDGLKSYGLREGAGLWAFAVVASEKPLPAYRQWLADRKPAWKPEPALAGLVWWYDGAFLETLFPGGGTFQRAKDEELKGPGATVCSVGRWLEQTPDTVAGVLGFGVELRN